MHLQVRTLIIGLVVTASLLAGCSGHRTPKDESVLLTERREGRLALAAQREAAFTRLNQRLEREHADFVAGRSTMPATLDILVLSGGGDYGAFGAGFLKGWGRVDGPPDSQRPRFDVVVGVSTGALIAPFAYLGEDRDYDAVAELYRNPKPDWVRERGLLYFLPYHVSFAEVPGLERDVRASVDCDRITRIAAAAEQGQMLAVNATNLDDGSSRPFDLGAAATDALRTGDLDRVHQMMLASAGIPGAFPPREIDGSYYVDGGVTANIIYGGALKPSESFPSLWKLQYPNMPVPRMRYWVIINNQLNSPPRTIQPSWMPVIARSVETAIRASTVTSLRHLMTLVELMRLRDGVDAQVRVVAIPDDWHAPKPGVFIRETMDNLADLGERMGADPKSWSAECP